MKINICDGISVLDEVGEGGGKGGGSGMDISRRNTSGNDCISTMQHNIVHIFTLVENT